MAKNYFNHTCTECNKRIKHKDVIGMNMKFNGRTISNMYCKKHLKQKLQLTDEQWDYYVETFKSQGCELF